MSRKPNQTIAFPAGLSEIAVIVLLAVTAWVSRYWYSAEFGLYEDDYTRTPQALVMSLPELGHQVVYALTHFTDHGKPLHAVMIYFFSFLGGKLAGLTGAYWVGFILFLFSAWLFYALLRRLGSPGFALLGGLAYCLFCADTTQAFLTRSLGMQPSLIFLLLAFHLYLSDKKFWAYLLAALILLNYETPFLVFLAAPLLVTPWDRKWLKGAVGHILVIALCIAGAVLLRRAVGESRISELEASTALTLPIQHMIFGPFISLKALLSKVYQVARNLKPEMISAILLFFPVFCVALWAVSLDGKLPSFWKERQSFRAWLAQVGRDLAPLARLAVIGLALLVLAYPLTFTIDPHVVDGRDSRVHFAAVIGAAWLAGCFGALLLQLAQAALHKLAGAAALAAYFSLLVAYGFVIQGDYALAWQQQRIFWTELIPLTGDASEGTLILVEPAVPRATGQIGVMTWQTPHVLALIYTYPDDWQRAPRVYRLEPGWEAALIDSTGRFQLNGQTSFIPESLFVNADSTNVIFIEAREDHLARRVQPLNIGGKLYPLKQPAADTTFPDGPLHALILLP